MTLSVSHIILEEFWPTLFYNIAPVYWGLWAFVYAQLSPQHFSQDELWTLTGLLQHLYSFLFSHSVVGLLVCLGLLSCCITQLFSCRTDVLTFDSRILWYIHSYTEEFMVDSMTVRCPGPAATKQAQNPQPSSNMLDFWYEVFVLISSLGFHKTWYCALWPNISTLVSSVKRILF